MAAPTEYIRGTNFASAQAAAPSLPPNGAAMDGEFDRIKNALDQTQNSLSLVQRDDGALANGVVTLDSLSAEVSVGLEPAEPWFPATNYLRNRTVFFSTGLTVKLYRALASHTSSAMFSTDLAEGRWLELADFTPPTVVGVVALANGGTGADNANDARANLGLGAVATRSVVPVSEGGTGATDAAGARTALGISIGAGGTVQGYSAQLDAVAGLASTGLVARTGAGAAAARTITGGAFVTVTNGNGVSGNPTVDIPASVVVTAAEGITGNNNDTTLPTSAAVKSYADARVLGGFSGPVTASGTAVDFAGVPAGVTEFDFYLDGIVYSGPGTDDFLLQIGPAAGVEATGYLSSAGRTLSNDNTTRFVTGTAGVVISVAGVGRTMTGVISGRLVNPATNRWLMSSVMQMSGSSESVQMLSSAKTITGALATLRLTRSGSSATFGGGSLSLRWRF